MEMLKAARDEKFDVPVGHLDYGYIDKCNDSKELEKIVKVLRSGHEGRYPALEQAAELRLEKVNPKSKVLRKSVPVKTKHELNKDEWQDIADDLKAWSSDMRACDTELRCDQSDGQEGALPPVRGTKAAIPITKAGGEADQTAASKANKRVKPRDYKEWDKFDIDAELARADDGSAEVKSAPTKLSKPSVPAVSSVVDTRGLSEAECRVRADREKSKGNEAFQAGDHEEALLYYSRSLSAYPSVAASNNRAQTYLKLKKWDNALKDCNAVLKTEPNNLKALLRRGVAYHGRKEYDNAKNDLQRVLSVEPNNKRAKEVLSEVEHEIEEKKKKGRRMVIEEVDGSTDEEEGEEKGTRETSQSKKVLIEEVAMNGHTEEPQPAGDTQSSSTRQSDTQSSSTRQSDTQSFSTRQSDQHQEAAIREDKAKLSDQDANRTAAYTAQVQDDTKSGKSAHIQNCDNSTASLSSQSTSGAATINTANRQPASTTAPPGEEQSTTVASPAVLPSGVAVVKDQGGALFRTGQYGEAAEKYTQAINMLEKASGNHGESLATLYSNRAACQSKSGNLSGCVKDCNKALELSPGTIKALIRRAQAYEAMERYRKAYVDFRQANYLDSRVEAVRQGLARCQKMCQQLDGASWRDKLPAPAPLPPLSSTILHHTPPAPVPAQGAATPAGPTTVPVSSPLSDTGTTQSVNQSDVDAEFECKSAEGRRLVQAGEYRQARECYTCCITLRPGRAAPYTNRALCNLKLNQCEAVVRDCSVALGLEADNIKALFRRAQAYKMLKHYSKSEADLERLLQLDPKNSAARRELQVVHKYMAEEKKQINDEKTKRHKIRIEEVEESSSEEEEEEQQDVSCKTAASSPAVSEAMSSLQSKTDSKTKQSASPSKTEKSGNTQSQKSGINTAESKPGTCSIDKPKKEVKNSESVKIDELKESVKFVKKSDSPPSKKDKCMDNISDTKVESAKTSKSSPYEFIHAWTSLKASQDTAAYAALLENIEPTDLPTVLSNKLDGEMLRRIIQCVDIFVTKGQLSRSLAYLQQVTTVPRFQMITMFMSAKEKKDLQAVLRNLEEAANCDFLSADLRTLRKAYSLPQE